MGFSAAAAIAIAVVILVASAILPGAFDNWFAVDTTTWGATGDIWPLIPLLALLAFIGFRLNASQGKGGAA